MEYVLSVWHDICWNAKILKNHQIRSEKQFHCPMGYKISMIWAISMWIHSPESWKRHYNWFCYEQESRSIDLKLIYRVTGFVRDIPNKVPFRDPIPAWIQGTAICWWTVLGMSYLEFMLNVYIGIHSKKHLFIYWRWPLV